MARLDSHDLTKHQQDGTNKTRSPILKQSLKIRPKIKLILQDNAAKVQGTVLRKTMLRPSRYWNR